MAGNQGNGPGDEGRFVLIILNGPERQIFPSARLSDVSFLKEGLWEFKPTERRRPPKITVYHGNTCWALFG